MKKCNFEGKSCCPLDGNFLEKGIAYRATDQVDGTHECKTHFGISEISFKVWFYSHCNSFLYPKNRTTNSTARHVWESKENYTRPFCVNWEIPEKASSYRYTVQKDLRNVIFSSQRNSLSFSWRDMIWNKELNS